MGQRSAVKIASNAGRVRTMSRCRVTRIRTTSRIATLPIAGRRDGDGAVAVRVQRLLRQLGHAPLTGQHGASVLDDDAHLRGQAGAADADQLARGRGAGQRLVESAYACQPVGQHAGPGRVVGMAAEHGQPQAPPGLHVVEIQPLVLGPKQRGGRRRDRIETARAGRELLRGDSASQRRELEASVEAGQGFQRAGVRAARRDDSLNGQRPIGSERGANDRAAVRQAEHVDVAAGGFGQAPDLGGQLDAQVEHPQPPVVDEVVQGLADAVAAPLNQGAFQRAQQVVRQPERQRDPAQDPQRSARHTVQRREGRPDIELAQPPPDEPSLSS